jgi:hypothetical protein
MKVKVICFEDDPQDVTNLKASFKEQKHNVVFRAYDLREDWGENSRRAREIIRFDPDIAIVDIADERGTGELNAGFRIIRKLRELQDNAKANIKPFPVIAWSKYLTTTKAGNSLRQKVKSYRATPILKKRGERHDASEILQKAGLI